jgi:hypothetical protein
MDISKIKRNYYYAVDFIEEKIKEKLDEFEDNGIELPAHDADGEYSVTEEIKPNEFVVIRKVRVHYDELQVMVEGETEWSGIMGITDWVYFLDEVMRAIDDEYDLCNN